MDAFLIFLETNINPVKWQVLFILEFIFRARWFVANVTDMKIRYNVFYTRQYACLRIHYTALNTLSLFCKFGLRFLNNAAGDAINYIQNVYWLNSPWEFRFSPP